MRHFRFPYLLLRQLPIPCTVVGIAGAVMLLCINSAARTDSSGKPPQRIRIIGYTDDAMEPFITRDGRYLLFNNLNSPTVNTDICFAGRKDDFTWIYRGKVGGINTLALEGCPTLDRAGRIFFVSPRSYPKTFCTIYTGSFKNGSVTDIQVLDSISLKQPGMVNFDVDVSTDGKSLIFVDSRFQPGVGPQSADLVLASWNGAAFMRSPNSGRLLAQVNQKEAMQYAPTLSADKLTLYFTRFARASGFAGPQIYRSVRRTVQSPFGLPTHISGLGDFVEGTALSPKENLLYFHRKEGRRYSLYARTLP